MPRLPPLLALLVPLLAACSNAPEQPSDVPDRNSEVLDPLAEEPANGNAEAGADNRRSTRISEIPAARADADLAAADLFGSWAGDEAGCTAAAGAPVEISSSRYEGFGESCEISELVEGGDGFTASLSCERNGAIEAQLLKLTPEDNTLTLSWVARDEPERTLVRCAD